MASLSGRTTSGESAWRKYIYTNKNWKELNLEAETNGSLVKRVGSKTETILEFDKGTPIKLTSNMETIISGKKFAKVIINKKEGLASLSSIRKPTNFNPTGYEVEVVSMINNVIAQNNNIPIDIKIKGDNVVYEKIYGAIQVDTKIKRSAGIKSDPKADIILYTDKNKLDSPKNIYISHKKEGGPEAFQQYGGLSPSAGLQIYNHSETKKFLKAVAKNIKDDQLQNPMFMKVKDSRLKNLSIYGPDFGKQFGLQHTQIIGQGKSILRTTRKENLWELDFSSHMSLSGRLDHFDGDYTPVFAATYRAGRGFEIDGVRYSGARVGIYPIKLIATRGGVQEIT